MATRLHPEEVIARTGGCGRYQILLSTIVHAMKLVINWSMINLVFSGKSPSWWCVDPAAALSSNSTLLDDPRGFNFSDRAKVCHVGNGTKCQTFMFADGMNTVVSQWNLVCDTAWVPSAMASVQMFGVLSGNFICGHVTDNIGRKKPIFLAFIILFVFNLISFFSVSWVMFIVCRFFIGFGNGFFLTIQYNIISECVHAKWRPLIVAFPSWQIESALFALVAWLLKDWRYIHLATAIACLPFFFSWWCIAESFRWYIAHEREKDAVDVIRFISKVNKRPMPDLNELKVLAASPAENKAPEKMSVLNLFKTRYLTKTSLLLIPDWFALGFVYYGITFGIKNLSGNIYINMFLFGLVGVPTRIICIFLQNKIGRRWSSIVCYACVLVFSLASGILAYTEFPAKDKLTVAFVLASSLGIITAWSTVQTLTIELYPTVVRGIAFGFTSTLARLGAIIGPQVVYLSTKVPGIMFFVCAGIATLCVITTYLLPETMDAGLQDRMKARETVVTKEGKIIE